MSIFNGWLYMVKWIIIIINVSYEEMFYTLIFNDSFASIKILGLYNFSQKIKDGRQVER